MATMIDRRIEQSSDDRFFLTMAILMALTVVAGFSLQLGMARSSFASPLYVHVHALTFFGWVTIYLLQTTLATTGSMALHRRIGWIGAGWIALMVVVGTVVAVEAERSGRAAPVYTPVYFLIMAPLTVYTFAGLSTAAIILRRHTDWHKRLHLMGMAALLGPAFGRLLPMPLLIPYTPLVESVSMMIFPVAAIVVDGRRAGRVHPAWWWGIGTLVASRLLIEVLALTPFALALQAWVTAGSPGAALAPLAYPPMPHP